MRRLFVRRLPELGGVVTLDDATARHARVLRLRAGAPVRLFDGAGREADARIVSIDEGPAVCEATLPEARPDERPRVVLVQAMPKGSKLEGIVRMATELGVAEIHLATSGRTVARPDEHRAQKRADRLARIAVEAARQAGRAVVPEVVPPAQLMDVAARAPEDAWRVVLWERSDRRLEAPPGAASAWIVVGPEGGLASAEVDALESAGFRSASLGTSILRVETAAPVAVALVLDRLRGPS
jgi:16S rRNA (uracil1498-N3)-methyltransferase